MHCMIATLDYEYIVNLSCHTQSRWIHTPSATPYRGAAVGNEIRELTESERRRYSVCVISVATKTKGRSVGSRGETPY